MTSTVLNATIFGTVWQSYVGTSNMKFCGNLCNGFWVIPFVHLFGKAYVTDSVWYAWSVCFFFLHHPCSKYFFASVHIQGVMHTQEIIEMHVGPHIKLVLFCLTVTQIAKYQQILVTQFPLSNIKWYYVMVHCQKINWMFEFVWAPQLNIRTGKICHLILNRA
jgi:hypothetical protein